VLTPILVRVFTSLFAPLYERLFETVNIFRAYGLPDALALPTPYTPLGMAGLPFPNLLDDQLVAPSSPIYWALGVFFLLFLTLALLTLVHTEREQPRAGSWLAWARWYAGGLVGWSLAGLTCTVCAVLTVPFLSKRIWLVISSLGLLATCIQAIARYRATR
jgi:hypothetical protein